MKKTSKPPQTTPAASPGKRTGRAPLRRIHPVIIYPFKPLNDFSDLAALYELVERLDAQKSRYARPITVMDRKTHYIQADNRAFLDFRANTVAKHSDILDAWCVDTCQMWYSGLGK